MENQNSSKGVWKMIIATIVLAVAALGWWKFGGDSAPVATSVTPTPTTPTPVTPTPVATDNRKYKDGAYTATGNYMAPSGNEHIVVSLTIKNDKVTAVTSTSPSSNREAKRFQGFFSSGVSGAVVGKSIDQVNLTVISGSSLTPEGFMDALAKIKLQAKA